MSILRTTSSLFMPNLLLSLGADYSSINLLEFNI
jgi:hypothetical protein